jgi:hypothetical protein
MRVSLGRRVTGLLHSCGFSGGVPVGGADIIERRCCSTYPTSGRMQRFLSTLTSYHPALVVLHPRGVRSACTNITPLVVPRHPALETRLPKASWHETCSGSTPLGTRAIERPTHALTSSISTYLRAGRAEEVGFGRLGTGSNRTLHASASGRTLSSESVLSRRCSAVGVRAHATLSDGSPATTGVIADAPRGQQNKTGASVLEVHREAIAEQCQRDLARGKPSAQRSTKEVCHFHNRQDHGAFTTTGP